MNSPQWTACFGGATLPPVAVNGLSYTPPMTINGRQVGDVLLVATMGRGVWKLTNVSSIANGATSAKINAPSVLEINGTPGDDQLVLRLSASRGRIRWSDGSRS